MFIDDRTSVFQTCQAIVLVHFKDAVIQERLRCLGQCKLPGYVGSWLENFEVKHR